jgi:PAS domain S-box-containing protein
MSTSSDFQEFSDSLRERYRAMQRAAPGLLREAAQDLPPRLQASLYEASSLFEATLEDLGAAAEELQVQNDALFAARVEMEAQGQFYRELFDLAPAVCLVTTPEARITHANRVATYFFGRAANALVGRFLITFVAQSERLAFRTGLTRAQTAESAEEWPNRLLSRGTAVACRVRVAARRAAGRTRALQWIITEGSGPDDDLL